MVARAALIFFRVTSGSGCRLFWPVAMAPEAPPRGSWTGTLSPVTFRSLDDPEQRVVIAELTVSSGSLVKLDTRDDQEIDVVGWRAILVNSRFEPGGRDALGKVVAARSGHGHLDDPEQ